jgi:hypothetical protein
MEILKMRLTEYLNFITRNDITSTGREKSGDYTHFTPWTKQKRQRYLYQCRINGRTPVK